MLTCVCRPVSSSFIDKQSIMGAPIDRDQIVVTQEPKTKTKIGTAKPIVNQNLKVQISNCIIIYYSNWNFALKHTIWIFFSLREYFDMFV